MDELIRTFERRRDEAERLMKRKTPDSPEWRVFNAIVRTLRDCILDAIEAKHRMAEQTSAWDLGEPAWDDQ